MRGFCGAYRIAASTRQARGRKLSELPACAGSYPSLVDWNVFVQVAGRGMSGSKITSTLTKKNYTNSCKWRNSAKPMGPNFEGRTLASWHLAVQKHTPELRRW